VVRGVGNRRSISAARARAQQQTRRTSLLLSIDGTDRRTDGRTDGHPTVKQTLHRELCGQRQQHSTAPHYTPQAAEVDYGRAAGTTSSAAAAAAAVRSK